MAIEQIAISNAHVQIASSGALNSYYEFDMKALGIWDIEMNAATVSSLYAVGKKVNLEKAAHYTGGSGVDLTGNLKMFFPLEKGKNNEIFDSKEVNVGRIYGASWSGSGFTADHTKGWRFFVSNESDDDTTHFTSNLKLNFVQACATTNAHYQIDTASIPLNEWTHVGFTRASTSTAPIFYINGAPVDSSTITTGAGTPVSDADQKLIIGNSQDSSFNYRRHKNFSGSIQEIAVFSDVRSAGNMTSFYGGGETHDLELDADAGGAAMIEYWQVDPYVSPAHFTAKIGAHPLTSFNNNIAELKGLYPVIDHLNIFDSTDRIIDPSGWDDNGFTDFTLFTNNSIVPAKGINTFGIGAGLSLKTWQVNTLANATTHSHNIILVPAFLGFVVPYGSGTYVTPLNTKENYWKVAYIYDGIQEGELSSSFIPDWEGDNTEYRTVTFYLNPEALSKRVTHVMFFRATSLVDSSLEPDSFYRLVKNVRLDETIDTYIDTAWGNLKQISFTDTGSWSATYDAMTGISETVFRTMPSYKLSTVASGSLFAANCFHAEAGGALQEYMFKSKPYKYDQFDWTLDYVTLPDIPTALEAHNGKIYAFTEDKTLRINPTSLFVEDEFTGSGCLNDDTVVSTEFGLFYFDKNNVYLQKGGSPEPIGNPILKSSNNIGFQEIMATYDETTFKARAIFDGERNAVIFILSSTRAWVYSIQRDRWDFWSIPTNSQIFFNEDGDPWYISKGLERGTFTDVFLTNNASSVLDTDIFVNMPITYKYGKDTTRQRAFEWESKRMDMQISSQEKFFYQIDTTYSGTSPTITYGVEGATPSQTGTVTKLTDHTKVKIASGHKKKKDLKIKVSADPTSSTSISAVSLLAHGMLAGRNPATDQFDVMAAGAYTNIPTIDFDGTGGTGCTIDFTITDPGLGNIYITAPYGDGIVAFFTQNTHSLVAGDRLHISGDSDAKNKYAGTYTLLPDGIDANTFTAYIQSSQTAVLYWTAMIVRQITAVSVNTGGSGYRTGVYLPDTHTNTKTRLLLDPSHTDIGDRARIFINIDTVTTTTVDPTLVDSVGVIFRPPSKVKQ